VSTALPQCVYRSFAFWWKVFKVVHSCSQRWLDACGLNEYRSQLDSRVLLSAGPHYMSQEEEIFSTKRHTQKGQIINNDFTLWKFARKVKRPSMLATCDI